MKEILSTKYSYKNYSELLEILLKDVEIDVELSEDPELKTLKDNIKDDIKCFNKLGVYKDHNCEDVLLLSVETIKNVDKERLIQKKFVQRLIDAENCVSSLVAFHNSENKEWRLSYISGVEDKKLKRFSYLLGEGKSIKTVIERLKKLEFTEDVTQETLKETFSVGTLNDDFFKKYKELHEKLVEHLEKEKYFKSNTVKFTPDEFSKKLMGQIIFLYFVQKKYWVGVELFKEYISKDMLDELIAKCENNTEKRLIVSVYKNNTEKYKYRKDYKLCKETLDTKTYGEIDMLNIIINERNKLINERNKIKGSDKFIRELCEKVKEDESFLHDYLEPLFYNALNKGGRGKCEYFKELGVKVPFLNGGLFDHLPGFDWAKKEINIDNSFFTNGDETGILDIFDMYNFTVYEGSDDDSDYGIDPEMLGKIFETLMDTRERTTKGTVYTPRQIVKYMCRETLVHYLFENTDIPKKELESFIYEGDRIVIEDTKGNSGGLEISENVYDNIELIDKLVADVKVAEPSCGSGAYLVGMLQEITQLRLNLLEYRVLKDPDNAHEIRCRMGFTGYEIKLNAIKNSLYAVDIDQSAVHITKLRLWLSLVIDDEGDRADHTLPNLDFKVICGDSLNEEFEGVNLSISKIDKELERDSLGLNSVGRGRGEKLRLHENLKKIIIEYKNSLAELSEMKNDFFHVDYSCDKEYKKRAIKEKEKEIFSIILKLQGKDQLIENVHGLIDRGENPFFLWDNYFYDVYVQNGFDIVIGNPPYVESRDIEYKTKELLKKRFGEMYTGGADLLIYFYVLGFGLLKPRGVLSYITSNKWLLADYGEKFRKYLINEVGVLDIIDFGNLEIFEGVKTNVNILTGRKSKDLTEWNYTDGSKWE